MMNYSGPVVMSDQNIVFGGTPGFDPNPTQSNSSILNGAPGFSNQPPSGNTGAIAPEYASDAPIVYDYTICPWMDNTHNMIQPNMLVFLCRHYDSGMYNMLPLYRLNAHLREWWNNKDDGSDFIRELQQRPEFRVFEDKDTKTDCLKEENLHFTKYGILSRWNFGGVCQTKGESTGAGTFMDDHEYGELISSVSVNIGARARVMNVWGEVEQGDKLFLILTRERTSDGKFGAFQWIPAFSHKGSAPRISKYRYQDLNLNWCDPFVQYVGIADMIREKRNPSPIACAIAAGISSGASPEQSYQYSGNLPCFQVQLGI